MIKVSYKIKNERLKKKMTQKDLAKKIFVSRQTISSWENSRSLPSYENFVLLSKFFNIPIDHFYVENNSEKEEIIYSNIRKQKNEKSDL
ncbi:helix-turn-helix transcriptional regulator [Enterococcus ratti]|uniref:helix-turn-helix transcriptional regulator n=1 Tax=Enterococcus ratti TaxID=150033 RepID=UPI003516A84A